MLCCSNGVGRSGTFCAILSLIESLKVEGVVDVFYKIKAMRTQLPGIVQTLVWELSLVYLELWCATYLRGCVNCLYAGTVYLLSHFYLGVSGWL